jgi:hypothetical protein
MDAPMRMLFAQRFARIQSLTDGSPELALSLPGAGFHIVSLL